MLHNTKLVEVPPAFYESSRVLAIKWQSELPIRTPCGLIGPEHLNPHGGQSCTLKRWFKDAKHFTKKLFRFGRKRQARQESLWK